MNEVKLVYGYDVARFFFGCFRFYCVKLIVNCFKSKEKVRFFTKKTIKIINNAEMFAFHCWSSPV